MNVKSVSPILRMFNVAKAHEFYVDWLGFHVDWTHGDEASPKYMQVSLGGLSLHLSEHHGDACPGSTVFVVIEGLREFYAELATRRYRYNNPGLDDAPWGTKCMEVIDPFGNRLRFTEPTKD